VIGLDLHGLYDAERAAKHREQIRLAVEQRAMKRELFHALPVEERLRRLVEANHKHGGVIRSELRHIERMVARAEARSLRLKDIDRLDGVLRVYEGRLTDSRPFAIEDLVPEAGQERVVLRAVADPPPIGCDGSMTCDCESCGPERDARVRRGISGRIADADPLRAVRTRPRRARPLRTYEVPPEFEAKYGT